MSLGKRTLETLGKGHAVMVVFESEFLLVARVWRTQAVALQVPEQGDPCECPVSNI